MQQPTENIRLDEVCLTLQTTSVTQDTNEQNEISRSYFSSHESVCLPAAQGSFNNSDGTDETSNNSSLEETSESDLSLAIEPQGRFDEGDSKRLNRQRTATSQRRGSIDTVCSSK